MSPGLDQLMGWVLRELSVAPGQSESMARYSCCCITGCLASQLGVSITAGLFHLGAVTWSFCWFMDSHPHGRSGVVVMSPP